jgi:hypothetical protein
LEDAVISPLDTDDDEALPTKYRSLPWPPWFFILEMRAAWGG